MANNEMDTDIELTLGVKASKKSVDNALDTVEEQVDKRHIEINLDIAKKPIKGLEKEQKKILDMWEEVSKKGGLLSVPKKEANAFLDKYSKFAKQVGQSRKSNSTAYKELNGVISREINKYKSTFSEKNIQKAQAKWDNSIKIKNAAKKEAKQREKEDTKYIKDLYSGTSAARAKVPGSKTNLGYAKQAPADKSAYTTEQIARLNEISEYSTSDPITEAKKRKEISKRERESLVISDAETRSHRRGRPRKELQGTNKRGTTNKDVADIEGSEALKELQGFFAKVEEGIKLSLTDMYKQLDITRKQLEDSFVKTSPKADKSEEIIKDAVNDKIIGGVQALYTQSSKKKVGFGKGIDQGVGPGHKRAQHMNQLLVNILKAYNPYEDAKITPQLQKLADIIENATDVMKKEDKLHANSQWNQRRNELMAQGVDPKLLKAIFDVRSGVKAAKDATEKQIDLDKFGQTEQNVANSVESKKNDELISITKDNANTGFDTDAKSNELIEAVKKEDTKKYIRKKRDLKDENNISMTTTFSKIKTGLDGIMCPCQEILSAIYNVISTIATNGITIKNSKKEKQAKDVSKETSKALIPMYWDKWFSNVFSTDKMSYGGRWVKTSVENRAAQDFRPKARHDITKWDTVLSKTFANAIEKEREQIEQGTHPSQQKSDKVKLSQDITSIFKNHKVLEAIRNAFSLKNFGPTAKDIVTMNQEEQEKLLAERRARFGLVKGDNIGATGDVAQIYRRKSLWGRNEPNPFADLKLTEGVGIDSKAITEALQTAIEKNMFSAQTGGALRNLLGSMTFYAGMPSLEKSRAEADAVNTIMANIRDAALEILQQIQGKETDLRGLEKRGLVKFDKEGKLIEDRTEGKAGTKLFADMEEQKLALQSVLAEASMVEEVVKQTGGNLTKILQQLGFVAPELRKNNKIIQNINAGLDKNGKVLKFQTRSAEVLNYSFQLMARHIGQMIKRWMLMLNPINLIKKAFSDFASYDVKWQRTMNVLKYNFRRIIRPAMEWIAQQLVNIIGLGNALVKGIGKALGYDWDLFDQAAAATEKMHEEMEAAANVTAGFDELHDIGSDNSAAGDLMGDIYTPQWDSLYKGIETFGEKVAGIFKWIQKTTEGWNFWNWLALAGAAVGGFLALKWLLGLFSGGKNPMQSVADGFKFLEKAVGWALLIAAFTLFTEALTDFVECMKDADWEDIGKSLAMLGGAFLILGLTAGGLIALSSALKVLAPALLGLAAVIGAFALLTLALTEFIKVTKECTSEELLKAWAALAAGLATVGLVIMALLIALSAIIATGVGAIAIVALAALLAIIALIIEAMADFVRALGEAGEGIKKICEGIAEVIEKIGEAVAKYVIAMGEAISKVVTAVANGIKTILEPIMIFIDSVIGKIIHLAEVIAHEIGETIRTIIQTVGDVIIGIIHEIINAIPTLLDSILNFIGNLGPAIERSADSIMRTITKVINFIVSGVEYLINLAVDGVNGIINAINGLSQYIGITIPRVGKTSIERFKPQYYERGTNYVPSDGLAYLHQGEAVIPAKYNKPYQQGLSNEERAYMQQMMLTMKSLDGTMKQGIVVNGQFVQRGSDLVAVVNKTNSQTGSDLLSNVSYAR